MKREEKSSLVSALNGLLGQGAGVFVIENRGVTVKEMESLRRELSPVTSVFKVIKNRLFKLAVKDTPFADVSDMMKRPTAVAIATDPLAVTKVLAKFAEVHPNIVIVGGKMDADL
ncbi:MAG: 50S ribosomal protein L10, partial [Alphaproteobacteria bacterium]|nr:50S ribosomal protein L10 [Alphaproteobacteria bacterium]